MIYPLNMKTFLLSALLVCLVLPAVLGQQVAVEKTDKLIDAINMLLSQGKLETVEYATPMPEAASPGASPEEDAAPEGGDFVEQLKSYWSGENLVLAIYTFTSAYVEKTDSVWFEADKPIYVSSLSQELMTGTNVRSKIWLDDDRLVKWLENNSDQHEPGTFVEVDSGLEEMAGKVYATAGRIREINQQKKIE